MSRFVDWMFRNRATGEITIGQPANLPIKVFAGTTVVGVLLPRSQLRTAAGVVAVGALAWWGADELLRGVNPFRRLSGVIALGAIVAVGMRRSSR